MTDADRLASVIGDLHRDRWKAHEFFFPHRHRDPSATAHREIVANIYHPHPRVSIEGFRGIGKSTMAEEAIVVRAAFREFHNLVILGASYARAVERLAAVKRELQQNELLTSIFGALHNPSLQWTESKVVLTNGACIQALGRDQSLLGLKHLDWRPDAALIDDVEDPDEVRTDADRSKTWDWFLLSFLPMLDDPDRSWIRALGTRRGRGSLPERLEDAGWRVAKYPLTYIDKEGGERATWHGKFPLDKCREIRGQYRGRMDLFAQEYLCRPFSEADRTFSREMLRCEVRPRASHLAVYAMYDPARTTNRSSALTGRAVWSWERNRLIFWEAGAEAWLPDQIIDDMFRCNRQYDLTWLGFEEDGLNEWAKQPIRTEMLRRNTMLPLLPVKAPRSKHQFISGLQPYMKAGEVIFAGEAGGFAEAFDEFLAFPTGKIDAPNACAYALLLRLGAPVYDGFSDENVAEALGPIAGQPLYLAANADGSLVTAALVQRSEGEVRILADWVREGAPADVVGEIHAEAMLGAETSSWEERTIYGEGEDIFKLPVVQRVLTTNPIRWIVPGHHGDTWRNVGLVQAVRAIPQQVSIAPEHGPAADDAARAAFARLLENRRAGRPGLLVGTGARWVLRALAGGYSKSTNSRGQPNAAPDAGVYRLLMEGIEAFVAIGIGRPPREDDRQPVAFDRYGNAYKSAMPNRARG